MGGHYLFLVHIWWFELSLQDRTVSKDNKDNFRLEIPTILETQET